MGNDFVTERELQANLKPIREDIWEIKADVKTVLLSQASSQARVEEKAAATSQANDRRARRLAVVSLIAACTGCLWWVPQALANVGIHL